MPRSEPLPGTEVDIAHWCMNTTIMSTDGSRDFASTADTRADHYEVQVDDGYATEAQRLLSTMPAT